MATYDCERFDCERLRQYSLNGIPDDELRRRGIQPGSQRARELKTVIDDLFAHCCAVYLGEEPEPEPSGPVAAGAPAIPLVPVAPPSTIPTWLRWGGIIFVALVIAEAIARAQRHTQCFLYRTRVMNDGRVECMYICADGRVYYRTSRNPIHVCGPYIWVPV